MYALGSDPPDDAPVPIEVCIEEISCICIILPGNVRVCEVMASRPSCAGGGANSKEMGGESNPKRRHGRGLSYKMGGVVKQNDSFGLGALAGCKTCETLMERGSSHLTQ